MSYIIPPINTGRNNISKEDRIKLFGDKMHPKFISKAQAEANPELREAYAKQVEGARLGAKITNQRYKERMKFKDTIEKFMESNYEDLYDFLNWDFKLSRKGNLIPDKVKKWFDDRGIECTVQDAIVLSAIRNAIYNGDLRSIEFLRDTKGEKPKTEIEQNTNIQNVKGFADLANSLFGKDENKEENKENKKED